MKKIYFTNYAMNYIKGIWTKITVDLPSAQEIAKAAGITKWSESSTCEDNTECSPLPTWLYLTITDSIGYWTSTPHEIYSDAAWYVNFTSGFDYTDVLLEVKNVGLRPVIVVPKKNME